MRHCWLSSDLREYWHFVQMLPVGETEQDLQLGSFGQEKKRDMKWKDKLKKQEEFLKANEGKISKTRLAKNLLR